MISRKRQEAIFGAVLAHFTPVLDKEESTFM